MNALAERQPLTIPPVRAAVETGADTCSPATIEADGERQLRTAAWQAFIDNKLKVWLLDPSLLEDDGMEAPTGTILRLVLDYAEKFRDEGLSSPDRVVADANGGVVFERRTDEISEVFHFWDDGTLEYQVFCDTVLIERRTL
jgi:hypothetical protein